MIRILDTSRDDVVGALRRRGIERDSATEEVVRAIIADVQVRGDAAVLESGRKYDSPKLDGLAVPPEDIVEAAVSDRDLAALQAAHERISAFHRAQLAALTTGMNPVPIQDGAKAFGWTVGTGGYGPGALGQRMLPVKSVGVYVPGGRAIYPSSILMNAVPAAVASVPGIFVATPAQPDGTLASYLLAAMRVAGVSGGFKMGGAAALAAFAFGTESVPRVDKVVGPGNRFVNEAKRQLWGQVGVDGYAGPSEVCVLVDDHANAEFAAADLLTQIEHAPDNAGFLVATSRAKLDEVLAAAERQLTGAPREAIMRAALSDASMAILARDLPEAVDVVNQIGPEHLTLAVRDPERVMEGVVNAGCILLGEFTPESVGDFCLGPSHTLPTGSAARWQSPVNVLDFLKVQSVAHLTPETLRPLIPIVEAFGGMEGFPAHARGATIRRGD